jgi:cell division protein FtsI/penicillin-binding protein 2
VLVGFVLFGLYNGGTLFSLQVLQHSKLSDEAKTRISWKDTISPIRGMIFDSRGQLLAGNTTAEDVYVDKTNIRTDEILHRVTDLLAPALGLQAGDLFTRLKEHEGQSLKVATRITHEQAEKVREVIRDNGVLLYKVRFETQPKRYYPAENNGLGLAASVLGFTDYDNKGHYGVEEFYDARLAGEAGWILAEHDAEGRPLVIQEPEMQPAKDGYDLVLTIDSAIQYMAERELENSLKEFGAESGYIVVQDPNTGGILALANRPTFNPNLFNKTDDYGLFRNPAVNDVREPGSTMKILTYASSLDAGAITQWSTVQCNGVLTRYGSALYNATRSAHGPENMLMGLGRSCNIASMFAAEQLGQTRFYDYMRDFGIGRRTGVDLAGEVAGLIRYPDDEGFSPIDLDTNSFGQGIATTPIQLVNAVSAVANGGKLLRPHVMKEVQKDGETVESFETEVIREVLDPGTSEQIADMLAYGVENGLVARFSRVPGHHVSVKTGTAQVLCGGEYCPDGSFASAMGWAPSHGAKFTLYIGLLNPKSSQWGENTASVSWGRLAKELLMYLKVQPTEPVPTATP